MDNPACLPIPPPDNKKFPPTTLSLHTKIRCTNTGLIDRNDSGPILLHNYNKPQQIDTDCI